MNLNELLIQLHEYTAVEKYMMTHHELENDNNMLSAYLHSFERGAYPEPLFTLDFSSQKFHLIDYEPLANSHSINIHISQHTRYFPPVMHDHDFYELFFVYEGEFRQIICDKILTMHSGDICIIPPGVSHAMCVDNYSIIINVIIDKRTFQKIFLYNLNDDNVLSSFYVNSANGDLEDFLIFHTNGDIAISDIILNMYLQFLNHKNYYREMLYSYLMTLFTRILQDYQDQTESKTITAKRNTLDTQILNYINEHYNDTSLEKVAQHFNYSKGYISTRVQQYTGLPFVKYIRRIRCLTAANLLANSHTKINAIGSSIGYQSSEHFIRSFEKIYGMTPSKYRQTQSYTAHRKQNKNSKLPHQGDPGSVPSIDRSIR